jgi:L-iditol 2-dehydrogenase
VREFEVPDVGPHEVLIEVERCGVCGTDVHMNQGGMPLAFPVIPGHEFAGRVVETGSAVETDFAGTELSTGDVVTACPGRACGDCWYCNNVPSRPTACQNRVVYGFVGAEREPALRGGMSEYVLIEGDTDVFRLPDGLDPAYGALVEPLAVASHAVERSFAPGQPAAREGFGPGQSVAVQGAGPIGLLAVATARALSADEIVVVDAIDERLAMAERFGATDVVDLADHDDDDALVEAVRSRANGGRGPDVAIEAAGHPSAFAQGIRLPRQAGTLVEVGHFADAGTAEINPTHLVQNDVSVVSSYVYPPSQFGTAISLFERLHDEVPFLDLFDYRTDIDDAADAFAAQAAGESFRATIHP